MSKVRVIYVPWPKAEAGELDNDATNFKNAMADPAKPRSPGEWRIVFSDQPAELTGLSPHSQIYVLGHSNLGKESITNRIEELEYKTVCERLQKSGLSENYGGRLKFYNCFNALDAKGAKGENCFASLAAQYLRKKEFMNVRIFGYAGILCDPVPGRQKMYVAYGKMKAEYGCRAVRVEYDSKGLPITVLPVSARDEEYSSRDDEEEGN